MSLPAQAPGPQRPLAATPGEVELSGPLPPPLLFDGAGLFGCRQKLQRFLKDTTLRGKNHCVTRGCQPAEAGLKRPDSGLAADCPSITAVARPVPRGTDQGTSHTLTVSGPAVGGRHSIDAKRNVGTVFSAPPFFPFLERRFLRSC